MSQIKLSTDWNQLVHRLFQTAVAIKIPSARIPRMSDHKLVWTLTS